jgi:TatD DNase family protein
MTQFVDSHAHLDGSEFASDRDAVIERARAAGLRYLLVIGGASGPEQMGAALDIAETHDWIYAAAGIHPHEASKAQDTHFDLLQRLARQPKFLAVGEIGLDYYYDHSPRKVQKKVLVRQLDLAREVKLPIIIHCRDAWPDLRDILRAHWRDTALGGILHCFSGSSEDALELMDWGFLVSFAGNLTFKKADDLRAVAGEIPEDRLLTETDCPYLAPVPYRGKRNEPAYVAEVTRELAKLHNLSEEAMGLRVVGNFAEFFRLDR